MIKVNIEETINQEFEIDALTEEEALEKAAALYKAGVLVLDNPTVTQRCIATIDKKGEISDFVQF